MSRRVLSSRVVILIAGTRHRQIQAVLRFLEWLSNTRFGKWLDSDAPGVRLLVIACGTVSMGVSGYFIAFIGNAEVLDTNPWVSSGVFLVLWFGLVIYKRGDLLG